VLLDDCGCIIHPFINPTLGQFLGNYFNRLLVDLFNAEFDVVLAEIPFIHLMLGLVFVIDRF